MATTPGYFERKGDVTFLKAKLREAVTKKDTKICHSTIKKTIQLMTLGIDVSPICPEIIMASATNDIVQKKLVYLYLCSCAESNSELALLAINTLVKDAVSDDNAMIRGLAIRSMLNLRIQNLLQYARIPLTAGLADKSSYVRRNAVIAAAKLFSLDPDMFNDMNLLSTVRGMIQDSDGQVSYNALVAVNEIEVSNGGIKLDKELVNYLIGRLPKYDEFSQCVVLQILARYETDEEDEILEFLNDLDDRLKHANKGVVMATINLFLHFTKKLDWIKTDVYERIKSPLLVMLLSSAAEIGYPLLCHISVLISLKPRLFHKDYKHFFIRNNDPPYVRLKKLDILTRVVTEGNMKSIVEEIREYMNDSDMSVTCKAIYSIGKIALDNPYAKDVCVQALIDILHLEVDYITANCLQILQEMMIKYPVLSSQVLSEIDDCWEQIQYHPVGKSAVIWIYGEYGQDIPAAPYHLAELIENVHEEQSPSVKLHLLTAMMKLFFKRPPECQHALGKLLKYCIDDEANMDVRDRALFYYRLTKMNVQQAKAVLEAEDHSPPFPVMVDPSPLSNEDFHLKEFNTLSIVYDTPSSSFITQKYLNWDDSSLEMDRESNSLPNNSNNNEAVVEGVLLDMNEEKGMCLLKNFVMEKNEFQTGWKTMPHSLEFKENFTILPEFEEIKSVMESRNITLMACSRPEDPFWKFFFYAKVVEAHVIILLETIVYHQENKMTVLMKSKDEKLLETFNGFYRNIFIGKWIGLPNG